MPFLLLKKEFEKPAQRASCFPYHFFQFFLTGNLACLFLINTLYVYNNLFNILYMVVLIKITFSLNTSKHTKNESVVRFSFDNAI